MADEWLKDVEHAVDIGGKNIRKNLTIFGIFGQYTAADAGISNDNIRLTVV